MLRTAPSASFPQLINDVSAHLQLTEKKIQQLENKPAILQGQAALNKLPKNVLKVGYSDQIDSYEIALMERSRSSVTKLTLALKMQTQHLVADIAAHLTLTTGIYLVMRQVMRSPDIKEKISSQLLQHAASNIGLKNNIISEILPKLEQAILEHPFMALNMAFLSLSRKELFKDAKTVIASVLKSTLIGESERHNEKQRWVIAFHLFQQDLAKHNIPELLDPENQRVFKKNFGLLHLAILSLENDYTTTCDFGEIERHWGNLLHLLKYPVDTTDVYLHGKHGDPIAAKALDNIQAMELSVYREPVISQWNTFLHACRAWMVTRNGSPPVAFLSSGPATGKTELVKRTVGSVLKGELIIASKEDLEKFLNISGRRGYYNPQEPLAQRLGDILNNIVEKANTRNYVLFLDEFDLSNPKEQALYDAIKNWLNADSPLTPGNPVLFNRPDLRCPVVFANNTKEIYDIALRNRILEVIQVEPPSIGQIIVWAKSYLENSLLPETRNADKSQSNHINQAGAFVLKMLPFIIAERKQYIDDGVQDTLTIRDIKNSMQFDIFNTCLNALDRGVPIDQPTIEKSVVRRFRLLAIQAGWKPRVGHVLGGSHVAALDQDAVKNHWRQQANGMRRASKG